MFIAQPRASCQIGTDASCGLENIAIKKAFPGKLAFSGLGMLSLNKGLSRSLGDFERFKHPFGQQLFQVFL